MRRLSIFLLLSFFVGCGNEGIPQARIRAINASPDTSSIDVYDGDGVIFDGVDYSRNTEYQTLEAESHDLKITFNDSFTTFFDSSKSLRGDTDYTLILYDFQDVAAGVLLRDENDKPPSGQAKIRIIHAAPSLDGVDLYITRAGESLDSQTATLEDIRFREVSDYLQSISGDYRVRVTERNNQNVLADSGDIAIGGGRTYTMLLLDHRGGGEPYEISVIVDD